MPGHASSPYWTAVDFDSEGDDDPASSSHRVYLDPWDSEPYSFGRTEPTEQNHNENLPSLAGEPVSASFYYVPTKSYESEEEVAPVPAAAIEEMAAAANYHPRRPSRQHGYDQDVYNYGYDIMPIQDRRRSIYNADDYYSQHMMYESLYHPLPPPALPPPGVYMPPMAAAPRKRTSLPTPYPDYVATSRNGKHRRHSRYADTCDRYAYETLMSEYGHGSPLPLGPEEWARRALPKAAPGNFHLSKYGHLKIDYSCSWSSLDRLIRNQ